MEMRKEVRNKQDAEHCQIRRARRAPPGKFHFSFHLDQRATNEPQQFGERPLAKLSFTLLRVFGCCRECPEADKDVYTTRHLESTVRTLRGLNKALGGSASPPVEAGTRKTRHKPSDSP
jgi:hypothetical protein